MMRQALLGLALLVLVLLSGWWVNRSVVPPSPVAAPPELWLPALQGQSEQVTAIEVRRPGQPLVRLERRAQGWVLPAKADYPADQASVAKLLRGLVTAHKVAPRTGNAESFGLLESGATDGLALRVQLELSGKPALPLLIGKPAPQGGQLVRRADEQQVWLIDQTIELPANELHWLDRRITAIPFASVRELVLSYPHERVSLFRERAAESELRVRELPPGRHLAFATAASDCARPFADLQFTEVVPLAQLGFKGRPVLRFRLRTFAGGSLDGELFVQAEQAWLVLGKSQGLAADELQGDASWAYRLELAQYQMLAKKLTNLLAAKL